MEAVDLEDDFYLNVIDWSSTETIAVGLGSCVYLGTGTTSQVVTVLFECGIFWC